jgi:hypothetical protein
MEAVNHCRLKRRELGSSVEKAGFSHQVKILSDGEIMVV